MLLADLYQVLEADDKLVKGDEWSLASIASEHVWAPCSSFIGFYVRDLSNGGRILFRRRIARDEVQT